MVAPPIANGRSGELCYLFDIDGTIADLSHRLPYITRQPKDWDAFFGAVTDDVEIEHIADLVRILNNALHTVVFVSGRSDQCREDTSRWLGSRQLWGRLYMRKAGDHRPDNIVKSELLDQIIADGFSPIMAFDDRDQVVAMWRERGIPCAQVAAGDF